MRRRCCFRHYFFCWPSDFSPSTEAFHRRVGSIFVFSLRENVSTFWPAVCLSFLQVLSGYTFTTHLVLPSCTTPSCSNHQTRRTSWSGARPRALGLPRHTSPKPRKNILSCTPLYILQGRYVRWVTRSSVSNSEDRMAGNTSASSAGT